MSEEKGSKKDESALGAILLVGGIILVAGGIPVFAEVVWPRIHGATPADLAQLPMTGGPKAVAHAAPGGEVSGSSVRIHLRTGKFEYERADIDWPSDDSSAPNAMRLRPEHGAHQPDVATTLGRWVPLKDSRYKWGPVSLRVDDEDGDIRFEINRTIDGQPNPLFDKQVEAARELLLNAAFGLPVSVSDADLADTLGTGYPTGAVGKSNVFALPIEQGLPFVTAHYPSATRSSSSNVTIPLDHPFIRSVRLRWSNQRGGLVTSVDLATTDRYAGGLAMFTTCLGQKLGAPTNEVTDYAANKHNAVFQVGGITMSLGPSLYVSMRGAAVASDWATLFDAIDGCRDSSESGARSRR